jgi:anaerobic selenocysteine-containing dehydrogenase
MPSKTATGASEGRRVRGVCPLDCPDGCSWLVGVDGSGRAVSISGDRSHPFTAGALCGKVSRFLDAIYDPERLLHPLVRVGSKGQGRFERVTWDDALAKVAGGLRGAIESHGPEAVLPVFHGGTMGAIQGWSLGLRLFRALGASQLLANMCSPASLAAAEHTLGATVGYDPEDIVHARLVVLWGTNTLTSNVHQWKFVLEARARGAHIVAVDPLRTDTAARCDEHLAPLPGTDGALALGLMRVVLDEHAEDREWLARHTVGWPQLEARLGEWPVERAAAVCGLDPAVVVALGRRVAITRPTAIRTGLGLQRHGGAFAAVRTILAIPAVTGDWRHPGGGALASTEGHFAHVSVAEPPDMPVPAARVIANSRLGEALTELRDPPVGAIVVFDFNPAASSPNQNRVREGLARNDLFTVVLEQRLTDTTDYADVVLPVTMQPEHMDIISGYGQNYLAWNEPAIEPPGECRSNNDVFRAIAGALGLEHARLYDGDLALARQILDSDACRARGITLETLREKGWMRAAGFERGTAPFAAGGFPTPSGKVELWCDRLATGSCDPLVGYTAPYEVTDAERARRYPFALVTPAARFFLNSTFGSLDWHRRKFGPPRVHVHPEDAARRELLDGAPVRVVNNRGAFEAELVVTDAARPGVAFAYKTPWLKLADDGANPNATTPDRDGDLIGAPTFHDNRVAIEPI